MEADIIILRCGKVHINGIMEKFSHQIWPGTVSS